MGQKAYNKLTMLKSRLPHPDPYGLLIFLVGLLVLAEAFLRHVPEHLETIIPFIPESTGRRALFVIGILLLYLSEQISRRKKNAWRIVVVMLVSLIVLTLARKFMLPQLLSYCAVLSLFILERKSFVVRSDADSLRHGLYIAALQILGSMVVVGLIFIVLDQREFGRHISTTQTFRLTTDALFGKPLPHYVGPTRYDAAMIDMLRLTGIVNALLVVGDLFRPLHMRSSSSHANRARAQASLALYGTSSEDFFKLYPPDKHYFFYQESFVAYAVRGSTALVLDGACLAPDNAEPLRSAFLGHCHRNGWQIAVVHSDEPETMAWAQLGLDYLQIGSEAIIDSQEFVDDTVHSKHFRYVHNRAAKDALRVEWWQPPLSTAQIASLEHISDAWLQNGRQEYTFIMGPFSHEYLRDCQVAVLFDKNQSAVAYVNLLPTYGQTKTASIDHMRSLPDTSSVAMHFLLQNCIEKTLADGKTHFNLGFVPLAKLETELPKLTNRLMAVLRRVGSRIYSSYGLEQFKGKFEPYWSPRYLAYQGGVRQLPATVTAMRQIITYQDTKRRRWSWPIVLLAIASFLYASFPLASFMNPRYAWHGLTSALGGNGQPYAWFFNGADIVSGLLAIAVLLWLFKTKRPRDGYIRTALNFALVSVTGAIVAAIIPLPEGNTALDGHLSLQLLHHPTIIAHGIASFMNSFAFVVAAVLWVAYWCNKKLFGWRIMLATAIVLSSTVGYVLGQMIPSWSGTIQRVFVVLYGIWFVVFAYDLLGLHRRHRGKPN
jgi:phosphatidylglycerol lysyltransferase